ncbi:uncharacterized protein MONBRDRAFT_31044 [Monosiga brevicollis MX1]|uniref:SH2 domain-containing protein n=1 Tax=Monosiga brevicollis TaxID=81824 RepID=A9UQX3_MONBE|nr:uncharacterized protein MONBRDRAFT_31044 [Monosiga brevicollis MX1]EDQ92673.1 predicted protein [Monosiga brevicollis MX1]|eukprot:XP_001742435.1 hypothetical protein [Monosiga brevicollis MX1]
MAEEVADEEWFAGLQDKHSIEQRLMQPGVADGSFVLRSSASDPNAFTMVVRWQGALKNFRIFQQNYLWHVSPTIGYPSLGALVHTHIADGIASGGDEIKLIPFPINPKSGSTSAAPNLEPEETYEDLETMRPQLPSSPMPSLGSRTSSVMGRTPSMSRPLPSLPGARGASVSSSASFRAPLPTPGAPPTTLPTIDADNSTAPALPPKQTRGGLNLPSASTTNQLMAQSAELYNNSDAIQQNAPTAMDDGELYGNTEAEESIAHASAPAIVTSDDGELYGNAEAEQSYMPMSGGDADQLYGNAEAESSTAGLPAPLPRAPLAAPGMPAVADDDELYGNADMDLPAAHSMDTYTPMTADLPPPRAPVEAPAPVIVAQEDDTYDALPPPRASVSYPPVAPVSNPAPIIVAQEDDTYDALPPPRASISARPGMAAPPAPLFQVEYTPPTEDVTYGNEDNVPNLGFGQSQPAPHLVHGAVVPDEEVYGNAELDAAPNISYPSDDIYGNTEVDMHHMQQTSPPATSFGADSRRQSLPLPLPPQRNASVSQAPGFTAPHTIDAEALANDLIYGEDEAPEVITGFGGAGGAGEDDIYGNAELDSGAPAIPVVAMNDDMYGNTELERDIPAATAVAAPAVPLRDPPGGRSPADSYGFDEYDTSAGDVLNFSFNVDPSTGGFEANLVSDSPSPSAAPGASVNSSDSAPPPYVPPPRGSSVSQSAKNTPSLPPRTSTITSHQAQAAMSYRADASENRFLSILQCILAWVLLLFVILGLSINDWAALNATLGMGTTSITYGLVGACAGSTCYKYADLPDIPSRLQAALAFFCLALVGALLTALFATLQLLSSVSLPPPLPQAVELSKGRLWIGFAATDNIDFDSVLTCALTDLCDATAMIQHTRRALYVARHIQAGRITWTSRWPWIVIVFSSASMSLLAAGISSNNWFLANDLEFDLHAGHHLACIAGPTRKSQAVESLFMTDAILAGLMVLWFAAIALDLLGVLVLERFSLGQFLLAHGNAVCTLAAILIVILGLSASAVYAVLLQDSLLATSTSMSLGFILCLVGWLLQVVFLLVLGLAIKSGSPAQARVKPQTAQARIDGVQTNDDDLGMQENPLLAMSRGQLKLDGDNGPGESIADPQIQLGGVTTADTSDAPVKAFSNTSTIEQSA